MVGPLPNFHVAKVFPLILLNYHLLKFIFLLCCPGPMGGALFPSSYVIATVSSAALKPASYSFPGMAILPLTLSPCLKILHAASGSLPSDRPPEILPIRTSWGQGPSASHTGDSRATWKFIMQALNQIHNN